MPKHTPVTRNRFTTARLAFSLSSRVWREGISLLYESKTKEKREEKNNVL